MSMLVLDPAVRRQLLDQRRAAGADRYDEVWEGVYVMSPAANNEHQDLVFFLTFAFKQLLGTTVGHRCLLGCNISNRGDDWRQDYRVPDISVFLAGSPAMDRGTYWQGGPNLVLEVLSEGDRSRDKLDFYARLGVQEVILLDRDPWAWELYRPDVSGALSLVQRSDTVQSNVLNADLRIVSAASGEGIEVRDVASGTVWQWP